jgi:hypothetical protein
MNNDYMLVRAYGGLQSVTRKTSSTNWDKMIAIKGLLMLIHRATRPHLSSYLPRFVWEYLLIIRSRIEENTDASGEGNEGGSEMGGI